MRQFRLLFIANAAFCATFYAPSFVFDFSVSLRRDAKLPAAPSSSLAKAGSILTKAVGSLVGGSSGSVITQVCEARPQKAVLLRC